MQVVWRQFSGEVGNITAVLLLVTNILRDVYTKIMNICQFLIELFANGKYNIFMVYCVC